MQTALTLCFQRFHASLPSLHPLPNRPEALSDSLLRFHSVVLGTYRANPALYVSSIESIVLTPNYTFVGDV